MKFGEYLVSFKHPPWAAHYISYDKLKDLLYALHESLPSDHLTPPPASSTTALADQFSAQLLRDVDNINTFYLSTKDGLRAQLEALAPETHKDRVLLRKTLENIYASLVLLKDFSSLNYTGFVKILKKYDKLVGVVLGKLKAKFIRQHVNPQPVFGVLDEVFRLQVHTQYLYADLFHDGNRLESEIALGAAIMEVVGETRRKRVHPRNAVFEVDVDAVERKVFGGQIGPKGSADSSMIWMRARIAMMSVGQQSQFYPLLVALTLIFLGGCGQTFVLEYMVREEPDSGATITFFQYLCIALFGLKNFVLYNRDEPSIFRKLSFAPRKISLKYHISLVLISWLAAYTSAKAFYFNISVSLHMVFKSGILLINMLLGIIFVGKKYSFMEMGGVALVSVGVLVVTMASLPNKSKSSGGVDDAASLVFWFTGLAVLSMSLVLTGCLGVVQDMAYKKFGQHWKEVLFYVHLLGLPLNIFIAGRIFTDVIQWTYGKPLMGVALIANSLLSFVGVRGIYNLTGLTTSLTTSLTITLRKFLSLVISALYFSDQAFSLEQWFGAILVLVGSFMYTNLGSSGEEKPSNKKDKKLKEKPSEIEDSKMESPPDSINKADSDQGGSAEVPSKVRKLSSELVQSGEKDKSLLEVPKVKGKSGKKKKAD